MMARLLSAWSFYPSVLIGSLGLGILYLALTRLHPPRRFIWFLLGTLATVVALMSPLDILSDDYLFSAHMIQHLLLDLIVPPLLLLGLPADPTRHFLQKALPARIEGILGRPPVAWLLGIATLWIWHLPILYAATLSNEHVHIFEHLCFLVTGTIFWWPVFGPAASRALNTFYALVYLFTGALANSLLGIILTFAPQLIYLGYQHPDDTLGILPLLRNSWGLSPLADQQLGGVLMWVGGSLIFLTAILGVLTRWYAAGEERSGVNRQASF
ncbi:cytochrome c oxidase assembly protein [Pelobacter seleniigenes]|uniref:cytochrome c oxidase assembly protein n=1 Tax=Pelobacter seleniigenes TaxID=407188 RepID=UPI00068D1857|nr:cytochrome c oxidase assembly protein [Pelobacter seleniigenes]